MSSSPATGAWRRARPVRADCARRCASWSERTRARCGCQPPLSVAGVPLLIGLMARRRRASGPLDVALAATLHDPPGALADALRRAQPKLAGLYRGIAVATSPPTAAGI